MPARARALDAYASTYAIGQTTWLYLGRFRTVESDEVVASFLGAKRRGLHLARADWSQIERTRGQLRKVQSHLDKALASGRIDADQYRRRLVALA